MLQVLLEVLQVAKRNRLHRSSLLVFSWDIQIVYIKINHTDQVSSQITGWNFGSRPAFPQRKVLEQHLQRQCPDLTLSVKGEGPCSFTRCFVHMALQLSMDVTLQDTIILEFLPYLHSSARLKC